MFYYHRCNGYSRCCGASLGLTVTDDAYTDQAGLVHDSTEGDTKSIAELTTFVDGAWSLGVDVTRYKSAQADEGQLRCTHTLGSHRAH